MRLFNKILFITIVLCIGACNSESDKNQSIQRTSISTEDTIPRREDIPLSECEASRRDCNYRTHSNGRPCVKENNKCVPATRCEQLSMINCGAKSIADKRCNWVLSESKCHEVFDCALITDKNQCDGKWASRFEQCQMMPVRGKDLCIPLGVDRKYVFFTAAGPERLVISEGYKPEYLVTFGDNTNGILDIPADLKNIQMARTYGCGLTHDNHIKCWGDSSNGRTNAPQNYTFSKLSVRDNYACGLIADGVDKDKIVCFGTLPAGVEQVGGFIRLKTRHPWANYKIYETQFSDFALTNGQICGISSNAIDLFGLGYSLGHYIFCSKTGDPVVSPLSKTKNFDRIYGSANYFCASHRYGVDPKFACWKENDMHSGVFWKETNGEPASSPVVYEKMALSDNFGCFFNEQKGSTKGTLSCLNTDGTNQPVPSGLGAMESRLIAGPNFVCADNDGKIDCFGPGAAGILSKIPSIFKP